MPRSIEPLASRRAAQLKALAQVRNTLPRSECTTVCELYDIATCSSGFDVSYLSDKQLELIDTLAATYLSEVV